MKPDGIVIINDERVDPLPVMSGKVKYPEDIIDRISQLKPKTTVADATQTAIECGNVKAANVVLVGILSKVWPPPEKVEETIRKLVPQSPGSKPAAFRRGLTGQPSIVKVNNKR